MCVLPAVDSNDHSRAICAGAGLNSASRPPSMTCKLLRDDGEADIISKVRVHLLTG